MPSGKGTPLLATYLLCQRASVCTRYSGKKPRPVRRNNLHFCAIHVLVIAQTICIVLPDLGRESGTSHFCNPCGLLHVAYQLCYA
ncbi:hypothetical protein Vid5_gp57 [Pantoea phage vB_PagS_Vid5]|uniref:Uncharacterized protein n=1 Tax=Pantoea phage vB_PagS_Vid5 TaxID=2099652 RepID=A0A2P1CKU2_9CAUD|nr:hypothetical protein FDJ45_gp098 [Pantoea phage vB_PagS_Vid5]AVJ51812.1 hypothetical protein Vid5_gp57 [Pantoea phage vB_PagS_Vid5]